MEEIKNKVYCSNCKNFIPKVCSGACNIYEEEHCNIPKPNTEDYYGNKPRYISDYYNPSIKNRNNDCKDYIEKKSIWKIIFPF